MPKHETTFWLEKVREDEITISAVMPLKLWNIACYHAQQTAEKYIKSAIVEASLVPPRIHDLNELMEIHPSYVYEQILDEAVSRLTPMVSTSRYPGFKNFSRAEAEQAINDLALVKAWAMNLIQ